MDASELSISIRPAISPLRRRMIEDMTIRRFGEHTKRDYVRQVAEFTAFLGRSPDQAEPENLLEGLSAPGQGDTAVNVRG